MCFNKKKKIKKTKHLESRFHRHMPLDSYGPILELAIGNIASFQEFRYLTTSSKFLLQCYLKWV